MAQQAVLDSIAAAEAEADTIAHTPLVAQEAEAVRIYKDSTLDAAHAAEGSIVTLENDKIVLALNSKGAQPYSARVKEYYNYDSTDLYIFNPGKSDYSVSVYTGEYIHTRDFNFQVAEKTDTSVAFRLPFSGGGYIEQLYDIENGSYDSLAGTAEAPRTEGAPRVFVIGGGGSGIPLYRRLCRLGIPFAAGVLPENDLDLPTARALAAIVIIDRANEPVSAEKVNEAMEVLKSCERVVCTTSFGSVNLENRRLLEYAKAHNMLINVNEIE